jgi:hypothetical protein
VVGQFEGLFPQGIKLRFIYLHLTGGLEPVPFKLTHYRSFSHRNDIHRRMPFFSIFRLNRCAVRAMARLKALERTIRS